MARAAALLRQGRPDEVLADLEIAKLSMPGDGQLLFAYAMTLKVLGRVVESDEALLSAAIQGSYAARFEIAKRRSNGEDVTVDMKNWHP